MHSWGLTSGDAGYIDPADPATLDPADSRYMRADLPAVPAYTTEYVETARESGALVGRQAVGQQLLEVDRQWLVQDQQVDLVDAELGGALVEAVQRLVVAVVADPDPGAQFSGCRTPW